jgi:hypothetical protein
MSEVHENAVSAAEEIWRCRVPRLPTPSSLRLNHFGNRQSSVLMISETDETLFRIEQLMDHQAGNRARGAELMLKSMLKILSIGRCP